jgi:similar to stage IV sporulation protein
MFIKIILSYIIGYVNINVEGYYIERFINICRNKKIAIWNLKRDKNISINLNLGIHDFKEVCKISKNTKCKIKIKEKKGLPFILNRYRKRKIFGIFLILVVGTIILSSNYVWNVEIVNENDAEFENIEQDIESAGLKIGLLKSKINTKDIINNLRLSRDDIAWVGIELKGTNAIVRIVKADEKPEIIDKNDYCNIVADKAGEIVKINAQNGTANVKVGDVVEEGSILINGWMEGKYTGVRYVHAEGEIQAKVWYTEQTKILYNNIEEKRTGKIENKYTIKINNFEINFYKSISKFEIYDTIETENKINIFSNFYLPISIIKKTNNELEEVQTTYTKEEAKNIGIQELEEKLDSEIENKESILNKDVKVTEQEDGIEIYVTYEVLENMGTNEKIVF